MKRLAAIMLAAGFVYAAAHAAPERAADERIRGVALGLFASTPDYDYGDLVDEVERRGATDVLIVVQWSQANVWANDIESAAASEATIRRTIRQARERGLRVTVMPIIRLEERSPGQWRGVLAPDPRPWFQSYRRNLLTLARTAQNEGVTRFVVGSELGSMQVHEQAWRKLIADTRTVFDGELVYSANWDAYDSVGFWDEVDVVGVTGYFPMNHVDGLDAAWREPIDQVSELKRRVQKPVVITEIGYPSHDRAAATPWDQTASGKAAPHLQAELYRAFCDNLAEHPATGGYFVWNWFGFGGLDDTGYSPRGKPAAAELERCFARR